MSFENSNQTAAPETESGAADRKQNAQKTPKASGGILTRPAAQVALEIAGDQQKREEKANVLTMSERSALAQVKLAELRAAGLMRSPLEKFLDDPRPLRAIRRFCYECNGFSLAAATNCETSSCPLWLFRRGSGVIVSDELPTWKKSYFGWMKQDGELDRFSDDAESGADESELLTEEREG